MYEINAEYEHACWVRAEEADRRAAEVEHLTQAEVLRPISETAQYSPSVVECTDGVTWRDIVADHVADLAVSELIRREAELRAAIRHAGEYPYKSGSELADGWSDELDDVRRALDELGYGRDLDGWYHTSQVERVQGDRRCPQCGHAGSHWADCVNSTEPF